MRRLAETDSTNRYLLDEARNGAAEGVVVVADHQSSGRGRLGRTWSAPAGTSLLMSVLLRPALPPARLHLTAAAVALAARDACGALGGVAPGLKWPNDLVVDERKLAGVLAEVELPAIVVGLGLNLRWGAEAPVELPADVRARAVALDQVTGRVVDGAALLDRLLLTLGGLVTDWNAVARQYRRCCVTVGRPVRVELAGETLIGTAVDVTDEGRLLVDDGSRRHAVSAADVVHLWA